VLDPRRGRRSQRRTEIEEQELGVDLNEELRTKGMFIDNSVMSVTSMPLSVAAAGLSSHAPTHAYSQLPLGPHSVNPFQPNNHGVWFTCASRLGSPETCSSVADTCVCNQARARTIV
jgi:hypothetical protein